MKEGFAIACAIMVSVAMWLVFVFIVFLLVGLPGHARAAEATFGYQLHLDGGRQLSGAPIDTSEFDIGVSAPAGPVVVGGEIEAFQAGRAGLVSDFLQLRAGHAFVLGRLTLTPAVIAGYARALDDDFGVAGVSGRVALTETAALSTEVSATWRRSFAENALPLNAAALPHTAWRETALEAAEVWRVAPALALGLMVRRDLGTAPDTAIGVFSRLRFR